MLLNTFIYEPHYAKLLCCYKVKKDFYVGNFLASPGTYLSDFFKCVKPMDCNWYILCTKPKQERKVAQSLKELHIQNYCPINKKVQKWGKRQETIYEPLFASHVFVKATKAQLSTISMLPGVVELAYNNRGLIIAPDPEIKSIKEFVKAHQNVRFANTRQSAQNALHQLQAYLLDMEGTVIPTKTQLTKVALPSLGVLLYAQEIKKSSTRTKTKVGSVNR